MEPLLTRMGSGGPGRCGNAGLFLAYMQGRDSSFSCSNEYTGAKIVIDMMIYERSPASLNRSLIAPSFPKD